MDPETPEPDGSEVAILKHANPTSAAWHRPRCSFVFVLVFCQSILTASGWVCSCCVCVLSPTLSAFDSREVMALALALELALRFSIKH